jgi:hypothetical protein
MAASPAMVGKSFIENISDGATCALRICGTQLLRRLDGDMAEIRRHCGDH